jgi:hypothetical protein
LITKVIFRLTHQVYILKVLLLEAVDKETISEIESDTQQVEPDGGYGWLVVLGAFFAQVASNGISTSW